MREKELRLALVFFGGVSLAVYMHGISKEILKLVRASSALHGITSRADRLKASAADCFPQGDGEYDTEAVYFDLLRQIGQKIDLRVIVDIVAGASAGGINGVMLARALSHNLSFGKLRDLWLAGADVSRLLASERRAKVWSKWFLMPVIWGVGRTGLLQSIKDPEVRKKLSLFMRSRWSRPPFDGPGMTELMLSGVYAMGELGRGSPSLLPTGHSLDLFVTLTDFYGYRKSIEIHDPPVIREREHRHILRFACRHYPGGAIESDFELANAPSLAFAARATSAFPSAFPPARIAEIDRYLAQKKIAWTTREEFLERNFKRYHQAGADPLATSFIDGSVLNNKPFREAIGSIKGRPAYREVDRRLVYVDPDPRQATPTALGRTPGFFTTLKGALSDIPRNEPIADELDWVTAFNENVRRLKTIVDAARPQISQLVLDITSAAIDRAVSEDDIRAWRESVNMRVAAEAGFAYEGYVRLKLSSAIGFVCHVIARLCGRDERSPGARAIAETMEAWARLEGIVFHSGDVDALHRNGGAERGNLPRWVRFLLEFDVDFRKRRLSFLIQGQNRLYEILDSETLDNTTSALINQMKRRFYKCLEGLRRCERPKNFDPGTRTLANRLFAEVPPAEQVARIGSFAEEHARRHREEIGVLIGGLAADIDLNAATSDIDALLADMDQKSWKPRIRQEVLTNYLGFPFWDLLTFSITNWRNEGEFDEIRIDRISPEDAHMAGAGGQTIGLKGIDLGHFGAFFSRAYREHDYLLGRLNAAERLIDIVCDATRLDPASLGIDVDAVKRRALRTILDAERPCLTRITELIDGWTR